MSNNKKKKRSIFKPVRIRPILIIIIVIVMIIGSLPSIFGKKTATGSSDIARSLGANQEDLSYGIAQEKDELLTEKHERINSPEILNNTEKVLDDIKVIELEQESPVKEYQLENADITNPLENTPIIFDEVKKNPEINNTNILDWILEQPLNYWIFTRHQIYDTWTQGLLRRSIAIPEFNPTKWEYIDVDHNTSTGVDDENTIIINDPHHEVRIRLSHSQFKLKSYERPKPLQGIDGHVTLTGGLQIEVQKLVNNTLPLEAYIVKSISYEGKNYIWVIGLEFIDTPDSFNLTVIADSVKLIGGKVRELLEMLLAGNLSEISDMSVADINGPYSLKYWTDTDTTTVTARLGLTKIENFTMVDKTWLELKLEHSSKYDYIPYTGEIFMDSLNIEAPIDRLRWTAGATEAERIPLKFSLKYCEEREELIYATVYANELPGFFEFSVDYSQTIEGVNVTIVDYTASEVVHELEYNGYVYPKYLAEGGFEYYNCTHLKLYDVPTSFYIETTTDLASQINTSIYYTSQFGIVANIIDNLVMKLANRLYRIGKYLKSAAESIMTLPSSKGYVEINAYDEYFGTIEFQRTSGNYINRDGNFFAFYDDTYTDPLKYNDPECSLIEISISGRFSDLQYITLNFQNKTHMEVKLRGGQEFNILIIKGTEFTHAHFSNLPDYVIIDSDINGTSYSTIPHYDGDDDNNEDPEPGYDAESNRVSEFKIISVVGKQYLQLKIRGIPNEIKFKRPPGNIVFDVMNEEAVESFEFQITNNSKFPIYGVEEGHYAYISQTRDYNMGSGRISGIKHIKYDPAKNGRFDLELEKETKFQIIFENELDESAKTSGRLIINPLPSQFSMELPGIANRSGFVEFPDVTNVPDISGFSSLFLVLGNLGNELIDLMGNASSSLIQSIGDIGTNFAFNYDLNTYNVPLDIIADIERGNWDLVGNEFDGTSVGWTHGISMVQQEVENSSLLKVHMYLQGMPQKASFASRLDGDNVYIKLDFDNYYPGYDWLLIDIKGVQDRDVTVYFNGLQSNIDFYAEANLTMNLSVGGEIIGSIDILTTDANIEGYSIEDKAQKVLTGDIPGVKLGPLYIKMNQYAPILSLREILVSEIPARFHIELELANDLKIRYQASSEIDYLYTKLTKFSLGSWHHSHIIIHELPQEFELSLKSNNEFDIDKPLPMQGLPTISVTTSCPEMMDIYINLDGKTTGQRANFEIYLENTPDLLASLSGDIYKFRSLNGKLGALKIKLTNLPLMDDYKIEYVEFVGENLKGFDFKINTVFGVMPYFEVSSNNNNDVSDSKLEVNLLHKFKLFGNMVEAKIALVDIVYTNAGGGNIPTSSPIYFNSIAMDMSKSKNNVIIPAPLTSLYATLFSS